jgi:hypothetical protein
MLILEIAAGVVLGFIALAILPVILVAAGAVVGAILLLSVGGIVIGFVVVDPTARVAVAIVVAGGALIYWGDMRKYRRRQAAKQQTGFVSAHAVEPSAPRAAPQEAFSGPTHSELEILKGHCAVAKAILPPPPAERIVIGRNKKEGENNK